MAQQLGVSTRALQEYRYVASQVGIGQDHLDAGLQKLTRSIGQAANGAKVQTAAFDALGVSIRDQNGNLKSTDQILSELIAAFSRIPDPARRAALETQLFGKAGQQLDTLLAGGVSQVNNLRDAAHRLGIVLSSEQIQKADDAADKLASVQQVMTANISAVVADNADAILRLADSFATLTANVLGSVTAFANYRNVRGLATGDIAAGRDLLKSKSGRAALAGYYDQRLSENTAARRQPGLSAAEAKRLDGEIVQAKKLRDLAIAYDARKSAAEAAVPKRVGGGGGIGGGAVRIAAPRPSRPGRSAVKETGPDLGKQAQSIIDGLFPNEAELRRLQQDAATLGDALAKKVISVPAFEKAREALAAQLSATLADIRNASEGAQPLAAISGNIEVILDRELKRFDDAAEESAKIQKRSTDQIIQGYAEMAQSVIGSLQGLTSSIKGGDFLDILGSVIDVISTIAGQIGGGGGLSGLFGRGSRVEIPTIDGLPGLGAKNAPIGTPPIFGGARANGGPVRPGMAYLVGERGPEIFRPSAGGSIIPNNRLGGGIGGGISFDLRGAVVTTELYRDMERIANETSGRVVRAAAPSIAAAGADGAAARAVRQQSRALA